MQNLITVLTAEAESRHRTAVLERELEWMRRHGAGARPGASSDAPSIRGPRHRLRRLVSAAG
jgi:hypothetical protein